ncbi:hypothetical protein [Burkholderia vietnamiensis]|uniref:hypothetical protein n=1 Tax=Burkholderia vietnamiensis TaxID=60552 RepID=UPI001B8E06F1|nr:hypothetical protein [Burkholderia vietnamiensis]MBR8283918.1 hypothetical protein [Burkholderia vietnamiensis]
MDEALNAAGTSVAELEAQARAAIDSLKPELDGQSVAEMLAEMNSNHAGRIPVAVALWRNNDIWRVLRSVGLHAAAALPEQELDVQVYVKVRKRSTESESRHGWLPTWLSRSGAVQTLRRRVSWDSPCAARSIRSLRSHTSLPFGFQVCIRCSRLPVFRFGFSPGVSRASIRGASPKYGWHHEE